MTTETPSFTEEGMQLLGAVAKSKLDMDLQLAFVAWLGRVEGIMATLRLAAKPKEPAQ